MHASALIRVVISRDLCRSLLKEVANVNIAVLCLLRYLYIPPRFFYKPFWPSRNAELASSPAIVPISTPAMECGLTTKAPSEARQWFRLQDGG